MRIEDKLIEPYVIDIKEDAFTLIKKSVGTKGKSQGQITESPEGYFTSFASTIRAIVLKKMHGSAKTFTLNEYVQQYQKATDKLVATLEKQMK